MRVSRTPTPKWSAKLCEKVLPKSSILLVAHEHFGIDLAPGLSIKMDAAFVSDVLDIAGIEGADINVVRQEFGGQVSAHVRCDISSGAVLTIRPGAFKAEEVTTGRRRNCRQIKRGGLSCRRPALSGDSLRRGG